MEMLVWLVYKPRGNFPSVKLESVESAPLFHAIEKESGSSYEKLA